MESKGVAFEALYLRLRQEGFRTGVDQQLRMQELLERVECGPGDLKTVLCPIFATNPGQQAVFYRVFDEVFGSLGETPPAPAQLAAARTEMAEVGRAEEEEWGWGRRIGLGLGVLAVAVGLFFLFHRPHPQPPPPDVKPVVTPTPSGPVAPAPTPVEQRVEGLTLPDGVPLAHAESAAVALEWTLVCLPLLVFGAFSLYRHLRSRAGEERKKGLQEPYFWPLQLDSLGTRVFAADEVRELARRMRLREDASHVTLDVPATIVATMKGSGYPVFRYRAIRRPPEYVVLIERQSRMDHFAWMTTDLVKMLEADGVLLSRYSFEGDPRRLFTDAGDQIQLADLVARTAESRMVVFASSGNLFHPVSGKLESWVPGLFETYKLKAVLLADAPRLKRVAKLQEAGFAVVGASVGGLRQVVDFFESGGVPAGKQLPVYASLEAPLNEGEAVDGEDRDKAWLAACAVYPELNWNLTLRLGTVAEGAGLCEARASRMARMPWLRKGEIPAGERERLVEALPERLRTPLQESLYALLNTQLIPKDTFAFENWRNTVKAFRPPARGWREQLVELLNPGPAPATAESVADHTCLRFLEWKPEGRFRWELPEWVKGWLYEEGFETLGTRTVAWLPVALVATFALAMLFRPWATHANDIREVAGQVVLDDSGRAFDGATVRGVAFPGGKFALTMAGTRLEVGTRAPYWPKEVRLVKGGKVEVVVSKVPPQTGPVKILGLDYQRMAGDQVEVVVDYRGAVSGWELDCDGSRISPPYSGGAASIVIEAGKMAAEVTHVCRVRLVGKDGGHDEGKVTIPAVGTQKDPPRVLVFTAVPAGRVKAGDRVTLRWQTANADRVMLGGEQVAGNGSKVVTVDGTTSFALEVANGTGTVFGTLTVEVAEKTERRAIVSFTAEPARIRAGETVVLRWKSVGLKELRLSPTMTRAGYRTVPADSPEAYTETPAHTTTYRLSDGEKLERAVTVEVVEAGVATPTVTPTPTPTPTPPDRTTRQGPAVTVQFKNDTKEAVEEYWLDPDGKQILYGRIPAGASVEQPTYVGHLWRFKVGGRVVGEFTAETNAKGQVYRVTEPLGLTPEQTKTAIGPAVATVPAVVTQEIMDGRTLTVSKVNLNGQGNTARVPPGAMVNISFVWEGQTTKSSPYCPTCIVQLYFGVENGQAACFYSGSMEPGWKKQGLGQGTFFMPKAPGTYYVTRSGGLDYECKAGAKAPADPKLAIGVIVVEGAMAK